MKRAEIDCYMYYIGIISLRLNIQVSGIIANLKNELIYFI